MQKTTTGDILQFPDHYPVDNYAVLSHQDFVNGFRDGIDAYEAQCEDMDRKLTYLETCASIQHELNPRVRAKTEFYDRVYDLSLHSSLFDAGFLAGWTYAHLFYPGPLAATLPNTQPMAKIVPIRMQHPCAQDDLV